MSNVWLFNNTHLGKNIFGSIEHNNQLFFKHLNTNDEISSDKYNYGGYPIETYGDIAYLNLNSIHNPDSSFTLEFKLAELGTSIDTTRSVNYITFGYHIRGKNAVTLTVGRPAGSSNVVIGTITETSTIKGTPIDNFVTQAGQEYTYTLVYNNIATNDEKLKLFRGSDLISSSAGLAIKDFSIIDRKLFLGSSAWTNEPEWNNSFDLATNIVFKEKIVFFTNKTIDKSFVPGSPDYPLHESITNTTDAYRNSRQIAKIGDTMNIKFHSTRDVLPSSVIMDINDVSSDITQTSIEDPYVLTTTGSGEQTIMYTYSFTVTTDWPASGVLSYGLDFDGSRTTSNILPDYTSNIFIDREAPTLSYTVNGFSSSNVLLTIDNITDAYLTDMHVNDFTDYTVTFYASNETYGIQSNIITIPNLSTQCTIDNVQSESFYTIYASISDLVGNTSNYITPSYSTNNVILTHDVTKPIISSTSVQDIKQIPSNRPGLQVSGQVYDTASKNLNDPFDLYVSVFDTDSVSENYIKTYNLFNTSLSNYEVPTGEDNFTVDLFKYFQGSQNFVLTNTDKYVMTESTYGTNNRLELSKRNNEVIYYLQDSITDTKVNNLFNYFWGICKNHHDINVDYTFTVTKDNTKIFFGLRNIRVSDTLHTVLSRLTDVTDIQSEDDLNVGHFIYYNGSTYSSQGDVKWSSAVFSAGDYTIISEDQDIGGLIIALPTSYGQKDILTETDLYVHYLAVDKSNNSTMRQETHNIQNRITFTDILSDFADSNVATNGNQINLSFNSEYYIDSNQVDVTMMGDTITTLTSTNNLDWVATNTVSSSHALGLVTYSVQQTPDINPTSSFDQSSKSIYIQNVSPSFKEDINFSQTITSISIHNLENFIDDHTINSNNNLVKLTLEIDEQAITQTFDNKSLIDDTFTFCNLAESTQYTVYATISNVFTESTKISLSNVTTTSDIPTITLISQASNNANYDPVVDISNSTVFDQTTMYDYYVEVTDFVMDNATASNFFFTTNGVAKRGENITPGSATYINIPPIDYYWSTSYYGSYSSNALVPSSTSRYYTYGLIYDHTNYTVTYDIVDFDFSIESSPSLSNTDYNYFVRRNDTVSLDWTTKYKSVPGNLNVTMFNTVVNATSTDGKNWNSTYQLPSYGVITETHNVEYLGNDNTVIRNLIQVDIAAPYFDLKLKETQQTALIFALSNINDLYYTDQNVPSSFSGIDLNFNVRFTATDVTTTNQSTVKQESRSFANLENDFTIDGLKNGTGYSISCTVTDPANNTNTVSFSSGNTIFTLDKIAPVLNSTSSTATHEINTQNIVISNIQAKDSHSSFNIYVGLFDNSSYDTSDVSDALELTNDAVFSSKDNPASDSFVTKECTLTKYISMDAQSSVTLNNLQTDQILYVYAKAVDVHGNTTEVIFLSNVIVGQILELPNVPEQPDPQNVNVDTSSRIVFVENDDSTSSFDYFGEDQSGNNNHVLITTEENVNPLSDNTVVNDNSLDLSLTTDVSFARSIDLSSDFTFSTWFNITDSVMTDDYVLIQNDNFNVTVTPTGITVTSGSVTVFPYTFTSDEWNNISVISEGGVFRVILNGTEIYPSSTTGIYTSSTGTLTVPSGQNLLIDDIRVYEIAVDSSVLKKLYQSTDKYIQLGFETEGYIFDYDVSLADNKLLINNTLTPPIFMNKQGVYTFNQTTNENAPIVFSTDGTLDNLIKDNTEIKYVYDTTETHDPIEYALNFMSTTSRKVVVTPNTLEQFYYHSFDTDIASNLVTVDSNQPTVLNTASKIQPHYTVQPKYTNNTPVGKFAMSFDSNNQNSLIFDDIDIDTNTMTLSTWVNMSDFTSLSNNPIITQNGQFEFGIDNTGKMYLDLLNYESLSNYITNIDNYSYASNKFIISNININLSEDTYFYYIATTTNQTKQEVISLIETHEHTDAVIKDTLTSADTSILSKEITHVLDVSNASIHSAASVDSAYIYIFARTSDNFDEDVSNDFEKLYVSSDRDIPLINIADVFSPTENSNYLQINHATIYNETPTDKYYAFAFEMSDITPSNFTYNVDVSSHAYVFSTDATGAYPTLNVHTGDTLNFIVDVTGHPFWIKTQSNVTDNTAGIAGGIESGSVVWTPLDVGTYYYQCGNHVNMNGVINVQERLLTTTMTKSNIDSFVNTLSDIDDILSVGMNSIYGGTNNLYVSPNNSAVANEVLDITNIRFDSSFSSFNSNNLDNSINHEHIYNYVIYTQNGGSSYYSINVNQPKYKYWRIVALDWNKPTSESTWYYRGRNIGLFLEHNSDTNNFDVIPTDFVGFEYGTTTVHTHRTSILYDFNNPWEYYDYRPEVNDWSSSGGFHDYVSRSRDDDGQSLSISMLAAPLTFVYTFTEPIAHIAQMTINCSREINGTTPLNFTIDYSSDGITWKNAVTVTGTTLPTPTITYKIWQFDEDYNVVNVIET